MARAFVWTRVVGTPALWVVSSAAAPVLILDFAPGGYGAVGGTHSASRRSRSFLAAPANPPPIFQIPVRFPNLVRFEIWLRPRKQEVLAEPASPAFLRLPPGNPPPAN